MTFFLDKDIELYFKIASFEGSKLKEQKKYPVNSNKAVDSIFFNHCGWKLGYSITESSQYVNKEITKHSISFDCSVQKGDSEETAIGFDIDIKQWDKENYVVMPGAVYNGNRFESRKIPYSPKLMESSDIGPNKPIIITDVPRLDLNGCKSSIQQLTGDLSVPAIGIYLPGKKLVFWVFTKQKTILGDSSISISENLDNKTAKITILAPGIREETKYKMCDNSVSSEDKGAHFSEGSVAEININIYTCKAEKIQDLFTCFTNIMNDTTGTPEIVNHIPFSTAFEIIKDKYNRQNWVEEFGYYSVGLREMFLQDWQIGWTGGMISTYPLLFEGDELTVERVKRNFDFLFPWGIAPSGLFYDCGEKGKWYGGDIRKSHTHNWHLIRKSGDGLYYIIKQFELMKANGKIKISSEWENGAFKVADSLAELWRKNGQLGQFVDMQTGEIIVGGSTSAGIVPAALILAARYFDCEKFSIVSKEIAEYLYEKFVVVGITNGGPGDALQNPDSESCYGLLASFVDIYEETKEDIWLERAEEMAAQYATWVVPYDFEFPENSLFGKLGIRTYGSVYANTQNKHSAPGICTHSGEALFKLFRATGNEFYLEIMKATAHNIVQYLSTKKRPIGEMQPGWMNERVNMSDWLEPVGEIFNGSTWVEVSTMLTFIEIPGLYLNTDTDFVCMIDNFNIEVVENNDKELILEIENPSEFVAKLKIFVDKDKSITNRIGNIGMMGCLNITIEANGIKRVIIKKEE